MIDSVMDKVPPYTGVIAKGGLTNDPRPTVNGRGEAGSIIHIMVDGREAGTVVVAANGTWSFTLPQSLNDGEYRLTARASNDAGLSIPSTSYGIQVDTTPPSQPKIEAAEEGVQPVLSGRAEAYSTVTVYDGKTMLGTAKTAVDGTWSFQLPAGLSNGKHALTVTAMDPAGNTSVASTGFDVMVGPVAPPKPVAQAVLDEMGRDSGSFNFDRLTNDGTAGRLMSGRVSGALAAGEKVQVSTDGGQTWQDALTESDGTWMAIDPNAHTVSWSIQTRIVNADGVGGPQKIYDVTLDTESPPPPVDLRIGQSQVTVDLAGTGVSVGDRINLIIDDRRIDYVLSRDDIKNESAIIKIAKDISLAGKIEAAIVNVAGSSSKYFSEPKVELVLDFENESPRAVKPGSVMSFDGISITLSKFPGSGAPYPIGFVEKGFKIEDGLTTPSIGIGMWGGGKLYSPPTISLEHGVTAKSARFAVGGLSESLVVQYCDSKGNEIFNQSYSSRSVAGIFYVEATMPEGKEYSVIKLNFGALDWIWLDDITLSNNGPIYTGPPISQNVVGDGGYYAGSADTVFTVSDVSCIARGSGGIHGGAGKDVLKLIGKDQILDITELNSGIAEKISSVEVFDLTGTGNNTLKLSMKDVLNMGHEDLFRQDGNVQLLVKGDAGDKVELSGMSGLDSGNWAESGSTEIDGVIFNVYENAAFNVELIVQEAVTTNLV